MKCTGNTARSLSHQSWNAIPKYLLAALLLLGPFFGLAATGETAHAASGDCVNNNGQYICTYTYTGAAQSWTVPGGYSEATFDVYGAQGGTGQLAGGTQGVGGLGARTTATIAVTPGQTFQLMVGGAGSTAGGGFNGGGAPGTSSKPTTGGGGGGASDVRSGACAADQTCTLADRQLIAGGGGGGASVGGNGGSGGQAGGDGTTASGGGTAGTGGTATSGGTGGGQANGGSTAGANGQLGLGGAGGFAGCGCGGAGGGGGGLYGGGGGGWQGGGGGGSSFGPLGATFTGGANSGDGRIVITYGLPAPEITVNPTDQTVLFGQTATFTAAASGTPAPTVQWQFSTNGGTTWNDIVGATSTTLNFTANGGDGTQFRAVFTNTGGAVPTAAATLTVIIDTTPPVITPNVSGPLGSNGWYVGNATLTWTVTDPESPVTNQTGCETQNITADTAGVTFTCQATSAGGTDSQDVTIKRDATKPIVAGAGPDRAPNPAGWYNAPVVVTFFGSDVTSGIASCTSPTYSSPDSPSTTVAGTCTDDAGNISNPVNFGLRYDATAPVLAPTIWPNPPSLNLPATASPNASDATSGVASANCAQPNTSSTGAKNLACTATDNAGNTATAQLTYTVIDNAPTIAVAPGGACSDDRASGAIKLAVGDANTGAGGLTLRVISSTNTQLVPTSGIVFGGSGANRTMSVTAAAKKSGAATITVGVSDGPNTTNLVVTVIVGTDSSETINGTGGADLIFGLLGRNTINGLGSSDLLCGGNGVDIINGGDGDDTLYGNRGDDTLTGGPGADFFSGGQGTDTATDFTPSQGDTKDNTVEKVTTVGAVAANGADGIDLSTLTSRVYLPALQR